MNKKIQIIEEKSNDKIMILLLSLFLLLFFFFCSKMSPLYWSNEWSDINIYHIIGRTIMSGKTLYVDIFDHKGPLIFIIYGLAYKIIAYKFLGMFILLYVLWLFVFIHLFRSLSLFIPNTYSLVICALTSYFYLNYSHSGGSPEEFILIANIFLVSVLLRFSQKIREKEDLKIDSLDSFFLGIFTSTILLLKFNLASFYFFILLGFVILFVKNKKYKELYRFVTFYALGLVVLLGAVVLFLYLSNALEATIDTYILLNKKMVSTESFMTLFRLGAKRVLELFKYHLLGTIVLMIGGIAFPLLYLKDWILKICFLLAITSTVIILYFTGVAHFYYTLPLYCLVPIGLLTIIDQALKRYNLRFPVLASTIVLAVVLALSIIQTIFWGLSFSQLGNKDKMPGVNYQFAKEISKSTDPSLMVLSFGDAINTFTLCNIIPNIRYFSILNIDYTTYPDLRNYQEKVIENKEVEYIILNDGNGFYNNYEPLGKNYSIVDTFEGYEEFQNVRIPKRTFLYKRNEEEKILK